MRRVAADARRNRQRRLAVEVGDGHVIDVESVESRRARAATGSLLRLIRATARPRARAESQARASRSSADSRALRDDSARPSASRTIGTTRISSVEIQIANELPDDRDLLRVLLAEERERAARRQ